MIWEVCRDVEFLDWMVGLVRGDSCRDRGVWFHYVWRVIEPNHLRKVGDMSLSEPYVVYLIVFPFVSRC